MYARPVALGALLLGSGAVILALAGFLVVYGALVAAERPLERWYRKHNH